MPVAPRDVKKDWTSCVGQGVMMTEGADVNGGEVELQS